MKRFMLVIALSAIVGTRAAAQVRFEIAPTVGGYLPTTDLVGGEVVIGNTVLNARIHQAAAALIGGRATVWASKFGIEASILYSPSHLIQEVSPGGGFDDDRAWVTFSSVRAVVALPFPDRRAVLTLSAGGGMVRRSGNGWSNIDTGMMDVLGVVGAGVRLRAGGPFTLRIDIDDHVSNAQVDDFSARLQNDFTLSAGLGVSLFGQ